MAKNNIFSEEFNVSEWLDEMVAIAHPYKLTLLKQKLTGTDWLVARHQEEVLLGGETSLSTEEFALLAANRKQVREKISELRN